MRRGDLTIERARDVGGRLVLAYFAVVEGVGEVPCLQDITLTEAVASMEILAGAPGVPGPDGIKHAIHLDDASLTRIAHLLQG